MKWSHVLSALLSAALVASSVQANLLGDGDLEDTSVAETQTNDSWTLTADQPDGADYSAQYQFANWSSYPPGAPEGFGVWFKAFEGNQAAGDSTANADVTQTVNAPADGDYQLTFWAKKETNFTADSWTVSLNAMEVDLMAIAPADGSWNQFTVDLTGVTAGAPLVVTGAMVNGIDSQANPQSAFLDTFELTQVPEPASLALVGMGLLSLMGLRRKR